MKITTEMIVAELVMPSGIHEFSAEASSLQLRPGQWPESIETELGNGMPFMRSTKKLSADGSDLLYVRYMQGNGCVSLIVWND